MADESQSSLGMVEGKPYGTRRTTPILFFDREWLGDDA